MTDSDVVMTDAPAASHPAAPSPSVTSSSPITTSSAHKFRFSIDRGGTFTDVYAEVPEHHTDKTKPLFRVLKLLSEDPANYADAPREAIRRILEEVTGIPHPIEKPLDTSRIEWIRMGTTVATNALLERKGERTAFVTTKGFKDLLHIGNQSRARIFDLEIARPENVYERVVEVDERVIVETEKEGGKKWKDEEWEVLYPTEVGVTGEKVTILQEPDLIQLEKELRAVKEQGIVSLAVSLVHSYTFPKHEQLVGDLARKIGFTHISLSSNLMPMVKMVPRSYTACADAYLTPCIHKYLTQFRKGFDAAMEQNTRVWFMQSDGGLVPVDKFSGFRAVLSGPAGGVVGYAQVTPIKPRHGEDDEDEEEEATKTTKSNGTDSSPKCSHRYDIAQEAVIGFDMGGTSTDVSRYSGRYEHVFENTTAGITIQAPQLDINTVAAGGGSMLFFKNGLFVVGPESAGAHPGPTAYRKGGPLTITDANLLLNRLLPEHFPKIFGKEQNQPLDVQASRQKFVELTQQINEYFKQQGVSTRMKEEDVALGFIRVANESMCRPIRALTQSKGYDIQLHTLSVFGGAGGQHASSIARNLGLRTIFLHRFSGILSAYGLGLADVVQEKQEPCTRELKRENMQFVQERVGVLRKAAVAELAKYGFSEHIPEQVEAQIFLNLRYAGTDTSVMTTLPHKRKGASEEKKDGASESMEVDSEHASKPAAARKSSRASASGSAKKKSGKGAAAATTDGEDLSAVYLSLFVSRYKREYGFTLQRPVIIDDIRVRAIGHSQGVVRIPISEGDPNHKPQPSKVVQTFFEGGSKGDGTTSSASSSGSSSGSGGGQFLPTGVFLLSSLHALDQIQGPAMIIDQTSTTLIEPGCHAVITKHGDIEIYVGEEEDGPAATLGLELDNIQLSIFSHRFMSIAEQMGRTLQRTAISTNIKERCDFSCALFGPDGGLVANAPHLPVHLGAMQEAVKFQISHRGEDWNDGDVLVSNHPQAGGSHLPDITVITPVFHEGKKVFFVASRGHHSDIGGISPGSMPPFSKRLYQEGARIVSHKLVTKQEGFDEDGITGYLIAPGKIKPKEGEPACSATRNLKDNISDLKAQVAANQKGIKLMEELIKQYSLPVVHQYMTYIQQNAEGAVREMLCDISRARGLKEVDTLRAVDYMDDGSSIHLALTIDRRDGSALFDFTGTSPEVYSNTNAPPAVTFSAIIYCLRCQVKRDIPLNQGCLAPIQIKIPKGCFLNPSHDAAVVGGNVLTSQRVTDVVLKAFGACAASQGCMNNTTFGDESFGYYETIAGGAGGGPTWDGQSGVHTHMTNTRITDPEILERRYPVLLRQFSLRSGSGGRGLHPGGDGVIREIEFLRPLSVGILSERRAFRPYGLQGGEDGAAGQNFIVVREPKGAGEEDFHKKDPSSLPATSAPSSGKKGSRGKKSSASSISAAASSASSSTAEPIEWVYRQVNLGGKNTYAAQAHDRIRIVTPGGGGYGVVPPMTDEPMDVSSDGSSSVVISSIGVKRKSEITISDQATKKQSVEVMIEMRAKGSVAAWTSTAEQA